VPRLRFGNLGSFDHVNEASSEYKAPDTSSLTCCDFDVLFLDAKERGEKKGGTLVSFNM
jgi:hypothetical protein